MANPKPSDFDYVSRVMHDNDHGWKRQVVKLPCGHQSVEIEKPEDQWLLCSWCLKKFFLTWSPIEANRKIAAEMPDLVRRYF